MTRPPESGHDEGTGRQPAPGLADGLWRRRSVGHGLGALALSEGTARVAQVVTLMVLARRLGADGMGVVGAAWSLYAIFLPWVQGAPELVGLREIGRRPKRLSIVGEISLVKVLLALAAVLFLLSFAWASYPPASPFARQIGLQAAVLLPVALAVGWAFRGLQQVEVHAALRAAQALALALVLVLLLDREPLLVPAVEFALYCLAACTGYGLLLWRARTTAEAPRVPWLLVARAPRVLRRHGLAVVAQGTAGVAAAVTWHGCVPVASFFLSGAEIGNLTAALRLLLVLNGSMLIGLQLFVPMLARSHERGSDAASGATARLAGYAIVAGGSTAALVGLAAEPICVLLFGKELGSGSAPLVSALAWGLLPASVGSVYSYTLVAARRDVAVSACMCAGAVFSLVVAPLAFAFVDGASALFFVPAAIALQTTGLAIYAHASGLIAWVSPSARWLWPGEIRRFMESR